MNLKGCAISVRRASADPCQLAAWLERSGRGLPGRQRFPRKQCACVLAWRADSGSVRGRAVRRCCKATGKAPLHRGIGLGEDPKAPLPEGAGAFGIAASDGCRIACALQTLPAAGAQQKMQVRARRRPVGRGMQGLEAHAVERAGTVIAGFDLAGVDLADVGFAGLAAAHAKAVKAKGPDVAQGALHEGQQGRRLGMRLSLRKA